MGTTAQKLQAIRDSKAAIKAAIEKKGVANVGDVLSEYPAKIASIPSGSSGWTGHADAEGLRKIGWTDEDIDYFQRYGVSWNEEEDDLFKVPQDNIDLYTSGKLTPENVGDFRTVLYYLPKLDMRGIKDMTRRFSNMRSLIAAPEINTDAATNLSFLFSGCYSIRAIPAINAANASNTSCMFTDCYSLARIDLKNTNKSTNAHLVFGRCYSLFSISEIDISGVQFASEMFTGSQSLISLPRLDLSKATTIERAFGGCYSLRDVTFVPGSIKYNIGLPHSHNLTRESLLSLLEGLAPVTEARICTIGANNLAKLSDEEKAIATDKGWTLV